MDIYANNTKINLLELHRDVIRGKSGKKIIWQPRIQCWFWDKQFAGIPFPEPFNGMHYPEDLPKMYRLLGCSARMYEFNTCFKKIEHPGVTFIEQQLTETDKKITIKTPVGEQIMVKRSTKSSSRWITLKWEVESKEEIKVATWRADNTGWAWDRERYDYLCAQWDNLGLPTMYMPRTNIQDLYINTMGVEKAVYALHDWEDEVNDYFKALNKCHHRLIDVINFSPIETINFGDNVHCGTLSPPLFLKYVLPAYQERCEKLHSAGKFVHAHWDGDTKSLLPFVKETGLDGVEAITPEPQGDVTLEEVKDALDDELFLIDGIPAILFDKIYPVSMLEDFTYKLIEMFAPKLILGISDEISSTGDIERVPIVGKIVYDYNKSCL